MARVARLRFSEGGVGEVDFDVVPKENIYLFV
jgi:hypothetical protein